MLNNFRTLFREITLSENFNMEYLYATVFLEIFLVLLLLISIEF